MTGPGVVLVLRPLRDTVPVGVRLRKLLRYALRSQMLRCVSICPEEARCNVTVLELADLVHLMRTAQREAEAVTAARKGFSARDLVRGAQAMVDAERLEAEVDAATKAIRSGVQQADLFSQETPPRRDDL